MHTVNRVVMRGELDEIVRHAVDVEAWPEILPHYRWVTRLGGDGDRKIVEMAARRGLIPVKWRAVQTVDRSGPTPIIAYAHIWGVTRGMRVAWTFERMDDGIAVTIDHELRMRLPLVGGI